MLWGYKVFFQRYFAQKHAKEHARAAKADKRKTSKRDGSDATESDDEDSRVGVDQDSDAEEDEIWEVGIQNLKKICRKNLTDESIFRR